MIRKEPRYRFADESIPRTNRLADAEFSGNPPPRRFDGLSLTALGVIAAFGGVFASDLFLGIGMSGQLAKLLAAADQAKEALVDVWGTPFRRIEDALAHR